MRYEIVLNKPDEDEDPWWVFRDSFVTENEIVSTDAGEASIEELAVLCDQDAESCNAHDLCGIHRLLAAILYKQYGRQDATKTMLEIAQFGGLHGMGGVCRDGDAYEELGVGVAGRDWDGSFGD